MIIISPVTIPELPSTVVEIINQQPTVATGGNNFRVAISLSPQVALLKAPPLNPPKKK